MDQFQTFTHHGRTFVIEAEGWPAEEAASAAIIDLATWAMQLDPIETATLYAALEQEREALIQEISYNRNAPPLPAVRAAQLHAVRSGMQGYSPGGLLPTLSLEAYQVSVAPSEGAG
jgi:hypothetical protein